ncbi:fasciclin domain-containing protein [Flavobacterium sp. TP390]|uniref:Fasciclin domain-containing protein n=1 Tax=Flavobacterium profundi TaxID=1774945 RepID=A0A6I4IST9_9FLAO|nr:fasciclin domain-containing protein [Flavobacterium profundi]MVO09837.1 fasciclin domain-containing protein [Flavobacterium profundi]
MKNINIKSALFAFTLLTTFVSCDNDYKEEAPSIASIAVTNEAFSTLEAAAIQGGVAVVLSNPNPNDPSGDYTVFAPTNDAFARLGLVDGGSLGVLQNSFLTNTLLYHVSNGNLLANQIMDGGTSTSALGVDRRFVMREGDLYINGSKIIITNVSASNGTVHAIDKVMLATGVNIVESALLMNDAKVFTSPELTFLVQAVVTSGLAPVLADENNRFTIFAPTDAAFKAAGFATVEDVANADPSFLQQVLLNHAIADGGTFTCEQTSTTATTAGGNTLTYSPFQNGVFTILGNSNTTPANMVIPDILCSNGVVHVIDTVLLP